MSEAHGPGLRDHRPAAALDADTRVGPDRLLHQAISAALSPWRKPHAVHDPGKVLLDAAHTRCGLSRRRANAAARTGRVRTGASDPTVSRLIDTLAMAGDKALAALRLARADSVNTYGSWPAPRLRVPADR